MEPGISNLLYRRPELYESVYDGADHAVPRMCERLFQRQLGGPPGSIPDIGCGTGRDLEYLAKHCADCVGVDFQPAMVDYARQQRSAIDFRVGDMRTLRLGRTFQVILSLGWAIANIHTNDELDRVMDTFAAHSRAGTLLVLEVINPYQATGLPYRFTINTPAFQAEGMAEYVPHPREQLVERRRMWAVRGGEQVHDLVRFRLLYPRELAYYLSNHGFEFMEIYDNVDLVDQESGELTGPSLYVVTRFVGTSR
jgi:SAM-dependent methyltransferase